MNKTYLIYFRIFILLVAIAIFFLPYLSGDTVESIFKMKASFFTVIYAIYAWLLLISYFFAEKIKPILVAFGGFVYVAFISLLSLLPLIMSDSSNLESQETKFGIAFYLFVSFYPMILVEYLLSKKYSTTLKNQSP